MSDNSKRATGATVGTLGPLSGLDAPDTVLFDMDGVLVDVRESYRQAIVQTARSFAPHLRADALEQTVLALKRQGNANNDWDVTYRVLETHGETQSFADVKAQFESLYQGEGSRPGLWTREKALVSTDQLRALTQRCILGIVTGRPRQDANRWLEHYDCASLFGSIVCMEDGPLKPDPAPTQRALEQLRASASRTWLLGDTPDDMRSATRAGCIGIGVLAPGESGSVAVQSLRDAGARVVVSQASIVIDWILGQTTASLSTEAP